MGFANNVPVFLSPNSGWNEKQCDQINVIVRTARNYFTSRATQKQLPKPDVSKFTVSKYSRVLNLRDYIYSNHFSISFILNPYNFSDGLDFPLVEVPSKPSKLTYEGSNSDFKPASLLSGLGYVFYDYRDGKHLLLFHCFTDNWPTNDSGSKVNYSVYVSGVV